MTDAVIVPCVHLEDARLDPNMAMGGFDLHGLSWKGPSGAGIFRPIGNPVIQNIAVGEALPPEPMFTLTQRAAQVLFDALYKAGLRPSSGEVTDAHRGELAAVRAHLNDMRALAFRDFIHTGPDVPLKIDLDEMVI